jgi:dipeptidyl aminopeptidase/acylaminoacyl peptidase
MITLVTALAQDDTRVQAVVGIAALTDFVTDTKRRGGVSEGLWDVLPQKTTPDTVWRVLHDMSAINHVRAGLPPFLLIHGTADQSVLYEQSLNFRQRLVEADVQCDLITIENAPHRLCEWDNFNATYKGEMVTWLRRTLGGEAHSPIDGSSLCPPADDCLHLV